MDILVIGYGKIGRIKSFIWESLGRTVYVHDNDPEKKKQALKDGFRVHDENCHYGSDLIVDISTPASYHIKSLEWALNTISPRPSAILIEKPLASHEQELVALAELLSRKDLAGYQDNIIVNESYYVSSALGFVEEDIKRHSAKITNIRAELSKNRLEDVTRGRFVDEHLGSLGIELPHMIAMVQYLGVGIDEDTIEGVSLYQMEGAHNEGFRAKLNSGGLHVTMESYLGNFRVTGAEDIAPNSGVTRVLEVETDKGSYEIQFDPVCGLGRYKAKIIVRRNNEVGTGVETIVVDDDHLACHLRKLHKKEKSHIDKFLAVENSLEITRFILCLKSKAEYKRVQKQGNKSAEIEIRQGWVC